MKIAQLASALKFGLGGKVYTPFTTSKQELNLNYEVLFSWYKLFSIHRAVTLCYFKLTMISWHMGLMTGFRRISGL